jgi:hypothetical protein
MIEYWTTTEQAQRAIARIKQIIPIQFFSGLAEIEAGRGKKKLLVSENTEKTPRLFKSCMHQRIFFQLFFLIIFYILSNKIISINNFDIKKTW